MRMKNQARHGMYLVNKYLLPGGLCLVNEPGNK
jgi:hypothetical protein